MANQKQYSGWNSEAEAASLHKWVKAAHLVDTIRRIREKDLGHAAKLAYFKQELSKLRCFSFSQSRRFPIVGEAVNISVGEIKSNLDKVEELADKICAVNATNDTHRAVVIDNYGSNDCGLGLWPQWQWHLQHNDAFWALDAAFEALHAILNAVLEHRHITVLRDELENELGITWKRGPRRT